MIGLNPWLLAGGLLSAVASLIHLACIVGGPDWYRFFGAGERIAQAAERGAWMPALFALAIAGVLAIFAAYGLAGAGVIRRLPLMQVALVLISAVYTLRGLAIVYPPLLRRPDLSSGFLFWSSLIVLVIGVIHMIGTWTTWRDL